MSVCELHALQYPPARVYAHARPRGATMSYSVAASVQSLLHTFSEPADALSLARQASVASRLLTQSPGLFSVALNVLASAYQFHILQSEQVRCLGVHPAMSGKSLFPDEWCGEDTCFSSPGG